MADLSGKVLLNRYRVDEFLGRGGMAEVYKVWDNQRAIYLAMKILHADLAEDKVFLRRFRREAQTLAKLQHPHIVRSYGLETEGRLAFILMDYIQGGTLRGQIFDSDLPFPLEKVFDVMRPVCSALHYAHQSGVVHADIKPANIMIHNNGTVLVSDFGIARATESATATMVGAGTPAYMAPEQARGQTLTPQSDIYSLGIVLYEMLTGGERPFTGERARITGGTTEKIIWEQLNAEPPSLRAHNPSLPFAVESVALSMLDKDPANRPTTMLDVLNLLSQAATPSQIESATNPKPIPSASMVQDPIPPKVFTKSELEQVTLEDSNTPIPSAIQPSFWHKYIPLMSLTILLGLGLVIGLFYFLTPGLSTDEETPRSPESSLIDLDESLIYSLETPTLPITATPSLTPTPTFTSTPTLAYPLLLETPMPDLNNINKENISKLTEIARWGNGKINDLLISPDKQVVYIGSSLGLYIHDAKNLQEIRFIPRNSVSNLLLSDDGKTITFLEDSKVVMLDLETAQEIVSYEYIGISKLQSMENGDIYALKNISNGNKKSIVVINIADGSIVAQIDNVGPISNKNYADISPSGDTIALREHYPPLITTYSLATSRKIRSYGGHKDWIQSVSFSPDQTLIGGGYSDGKTYIWNMASGQPVAILSHTEPVYFLKFSSDNTKVFVAYQSGTIHAWDLAANKIDTSFTGQANEMAAFNLSEDETKVISAVFDGRVIIWSNPGGKRLAEIPSGSNGITSIEFSPDSSMLATGTNDYKISLWEIQIGEKIKIYPQSGSMGMYQTFCGNCYQYGVTTISFSPDGQLLASGSKIWDINGGQLIRDVSSRSLGVNSVDSLKFCPNQSFFISASLKSVHFLDSVTGKETHKISGKTSSVNSIACSPDGSLMAYRGTLLGGGSLPDKVVLMGLDNMVDLYEFRGNTLYGKELFFSPDGKILAAGASDGIFLWDTSSGREIPGPKIEMENPWSSFQIRADFSPDGNILVYISANNQISFFDVANNLIISSINIDTSSFRDLKFSPDGKYFATGHSDGTIRIWGIKP